MNRHFRPLTEADEAIVWQMLRHASHERTMKAVQNQPCLARYASGWGRRGDAGFVALLEGQPIGAAWFRLWSDSERGFGYIDCETPELAMAVLPHHRGGGVGTHLLSLVLQAASSFYSALSLNVRADNPAVRLYERAGFVKVEGSETINRTGGVSFTLMNRF